MGRWRVQAQACLAALVAASGPGGGGADRLQPGCRLQVDFAVPGGFNGRV